jgi:Tfp pilus assembly protein PilN
MINLLPPIEIQKLKEERNFKIVLHFCFFLLFFLISFYFVLFSIKTYFFGILQSEEILYQKSEAVLDLELEKEIKTYNDLLIKMNSFEDKKVYLFPIFEDVLKKIPEKIFLSSINIELKPKEEVFVSLSGISKDRETLLEFIKLLKEKYADVSFPPQILLKQTDIDFSITFKIK